jgi:hypothetical protein
MQVVSHHSSFPPIGHQRRRGGGGEEEEQAEGEERVNHSVWCPASPLPHSLTPGSYV